MRDIIKSESAVDVITDPDEQLAEAKDIQQQVEEQEKTEIKKFGTFTGVFVPTLLTILGVIMFLREGWVVGNSGLLGAFLIISLSFLITACTGLSLSSFVTNTRVGAGGAFSIISQALGLEIGGSIGIPLYLSQALAVTMYIFGFRAGWLWTFPNHPPFVIDFLTFVVLIAITLVSTSFAFRIQYLIFVVIIGALLSVLAAAIGGSMQHPIQLWGNFSGTVENQFSGISFWGVFAVFFPASTGIMAGANMSGELKSPRNSIPLGTLSAIVLSYMIYMLLAVWLAKSATVEELLSNYNILIEKAFWSPIVVAGLLAATFSSALASFVGAPRILQALGSHNILPYGAWVSKRTKKGEPLNAVIITSAIVFFGLLLRDLNAIAPLITMIFLITYSVINLVVLIEQKLKLISFRPSFKIPGIIPLVGFIGSIFAMFVINAVFGLLATAFIGIVYYFLLQKQLKAPFSDVRSGLFVALAEWSAKKVKILHGRAERAWKPNILLPIDDINKLYGVFRLVYHLAYPVGSVKLLGVKPQSELREFEKELENASAAYLKRGVFATFSVMGCDRFSDGVIGGMQALRGSFFRPNVLFLELPKDESLHKSLWDVVDTASYSHMGIALIIEHEEAGLGKESLINLWVPPQKNWEVEMEFENLDLAILLAYRLYDSWSGKLRVFALAEKKDKEKAKQFLVRTAQLARLPTAQLEVFTESSLTSVIGKAPRADLNIFPLMEHKVKALWELRNKCRSTCLFTSDSGDESAFA